VAHIGRPKGSKNKRKALTALEAEALRQADPRAFLADIMKNQAVDTSMRLDAAKALLPYYHGRVAPKGQNEAIAGLAAVLVKYV
jgi:hypothetical protein